MSRTALFGQYWAGTSFVHKMDPRAKMLLSVAVMAVIFCAQGWAGLAICAAFVLGFYAFSEIPLIQAAKSIAPLLFLVILTALLNVFFVQGGEIYFQWWVICISEEGVTHAAFIACRLLLLLMSASLLTLTTTTLDITEAFERLLSPFARIGFPAHELGMMMGIALRFLPQFMDELGIVYRAQISRGATLSANPFKGGANSLMSLIVPLFTSAFRHAETLSSAMDARCYHGSNGRTRLHQLAYGKKDAIGTLAVVLMLAVVIAANIFIGF
ncbi:MAG: energy-coupling factor transporter transmembrane protein EcfT [Eggerthellaceae bacterium]|nr:energy-coupling factor transporter transmembrane protein EcfT [Eggerthellaceae bacterium]